VNITVSKEDYLKAIAEAESEGELVIAATLARWLGISPPAVTAGLRRLKRDGLVTIGNHGRILLRKPGREIAGHLLQRHHLIERMLTEMFGMEWYKVHEEAERLEHAVSDDFERLLTAALGPGKSCPHGNSVFTGTPRDRRNRGWLTLDEVAAPGTYTVASVYERDRQLLEFLDRLRLRPGVRFEWRARNYDDTLSLKVSTRLVQLGLPAARRIWVAAASCSF
jgi:DtxR family transcriptional regulator, Mn-dependent transcriptional regulator